MRFLFFLFLLSPFSVVYGQSFNDQFYYMPVQESHYPRRGSVANIDDTLAYIRFDGPEMNDNAYFACRYVFHNDTLILTELDKPIDLYKEVEYRPGKATDSIYISYQVYQESGGQPLYDSLIFKLDGQSFPHTGRCDAYCASIPRPKQSTFTLSVWSGTTLLDTFQITPPTAIFSVRLSKTIFGTSCCGFTNSRIDFLDKLPETIAIGDKTYPLVFRSNQKMGLYYWIAD